MAFKEEVKNALLQLTITGKIFLLPLFFIGHCMANLNKKADKWLSVIGKFFSKLFFK